MKSSEKWAVYFPTGILHALNYIMATMCHFCSIKWVRAVFGHSVCLARAMPALWAECNCCSFWYRSRHNKITLDWVSQSFSFLNTRQKLHNCIQDKNKCQLEEIPHIGRRVRERPKERISGEIKLKNKEKQSTNFVRMSIMSFQTHFTHFLSSMEY